MLRPTLGKVRSMTDIIQLEPVDEIQVTTLYENLVDNTAPGAEGVDAEEQDVERVASVLPALTP